MVVSPPKPWERNTTTAATGLPSGHPSISSPTATCPVSKPVSNLSASSTMTSSSTTTPELPPKPSSMSSSGPLTQGPMNGITSGYGANYTGSSPYSSRYGGYGLNSGYGGYGGYSRMGGLGSYGGYGSMGGYGGMGGGYGGYMGGGMNGMGGMGGFGLGQPLDPNMQGPVQPSLTQTLTNSTQSTFQLLESLVMTFSGFSQLLESTFMMTHSSFFTFIQLIEQFNFFKYSMGKILSLFDLIKWAKQALSGTEGSNWRDSFKNFEQGGDPRKNSKAPGPSRKPIVIFFLTIFGIPYLMNKLIKALAARQDRQEAERMAADPKALAQQQATMAIDPSKLTFVRAIHPYHSSGETELSFEQSEIIAVLAPTTSEERDQFGWWKGRLRNGKIGWFPRNYVEEIPSAQTLAGKQVSSSLPQTNKFQRILEEEAEAKVANPKSSIELTSNTSKY